MKSLLLSSSLFPQLPHSLLLSHTNNHRATPLLHRRVSASATTHPRPKVIVIMGPTGCGKTKLSIDLAADFFPSSEIINSDKIQVHRGLDITTNKVPLSDRKSVPHHLLGHSDPSADFTPSHFRSSASQIISRAAALPFVVGGSNSFVHALLADDHTFDPAPAADVFAAGGFCREPRFDCCFLWVDVAPPVLARYVDKRVDDMLAKGMLDELAHYFAGLGPARLDYRGLNRAIGVPEFERYFRGAATYEEAVREVKENTWRLVERQVEKIRRLREEAGWEMNRVDNTATLAAALEGADAAEIWKKQVLQPSAEIVERFLMN